MTQVIYKNISMGLFARHKLLFSFLIAVQIQIQAGLVDTKLFKLMVNQQVVLDPEQIAVPNPDPSLYQNYPLAYWLQLHHPQYSTLIQDLSDHLALFKTWAASLSNTGILQLPLEKYDALLPFEKLLLFQVMRPERQMIAIDEYIRQSLGEHYVKGHPNSLDSVFGESDKYTPIIFLLESGADPLSSIVSFAEARKAQLITVSLGQG